MLLRTIRCLETMRHFDTVWCAVWEWYSTYFSSVHFGPGDVPQHLWKLTHCSLSQCKLIFVFCWRYGLPTNEWCKWLFQVSRCGNALNTEQRHTGPVLGGRLRKWTVLVPQLLLEPGQWTGTRWPAPSDWPKIGNWLCQVTGGHS